ncbi:MAG: hypothetical protein WCA27_00890 [Candidatus Sulfotelmatobacter sp.]
MGGAVYNSGIPNASANSVCRALTLAHILRVVAQLSFLLLGLTIAATAADWNEPEQQLARKIVAVTGPGAVALTVENRSSLGKRDNEVIQNGLRSALEGLGIRFVNAEQAAATVAISLSANLLSYVWVAEIRQGTGEAVVVMVSAPRPAGMTGAHESVPLSLRKIPLWTQDDPILDVAVLEENATPTHIAVLDAERVALYRWQGGKWQQEQALALVHTRPWPRDLRGRLVPARDHLLDVYLPGVICRSAAAMPLTLNCRETDDPWPLVPAALSGGIFSASPGAASTSAAIPPMGAFYAPTRNFYTGALTSGIGKFTTVSKFYSAAFLPRDKYLLWLFAATDRHVHMVDGVSDQVARFDWGSDLTTVKTSCGAGWQVLATSSEASAEEGAGDSVRAYEFPDRDPVAVSTAIDFSGSITTLWTEAKADTAIAVAKNRETGNYEAFRLAVVCSQ